MKITGAVKMEATVDATGNVTDVKVLEGNTMLANAAEEAVRKWKYEAASGTTTETVTLKFNMIF
jgi:TonB family protein